MTIEAQENWKWVVIGRDNCSFCKKVKELLDRRGISYLYLSTSEYGVLADFLEGNGLKTVPQVYLNGNLIGGFSGTDEFLGRWEGYKS